MYQGRTFNRESVYVCGEYLEGDIYPVYQQAGKRRRKCRPTSAIQERLNQRNAERKLTRLIHANFTEDDIALHLTYREEPANESEATRLLGNFLRRLKRQYGKFGLELRYISCTEYGKRSGRAHHHLILTGGVSRDKIEKLWGLGYANTKRLQFTEDEGVAGLARYMVKDKRFYKRWNQSRNLIIPEPMQTDGELSMGDIAEICEAIDEGRAYKLFEDRYPDFELIEARWDSNNINRGAYIRFEMRRREISQKRRN